MNENLPQNDEIQRSREVAEAAREAEWQGAGFLRDMFLGNFRLKLIHPYPLAESDRPEFKAWLAQFETFLREKVDPVQIDETGEYPDGVIAELRKMGAFGMKISKEYGGLGKNQVEYGQVMQVLDSKATNATRFYRTQIP